MFYDVSLMLSDVSISCCDVLQVFVDRKFVGCLDYKTHEVELPDAKVFTFTV